MPGRQANTRDVPNDRDAWLLAVAWDSYVRAGDAGACAYGFRAGGSPLRGPAHRDACLADVEGILLPGIQRRIADAVASGASGAAERDDLADLDRLRRWLSSWSDADLMVPSG